MFADLFRSARFRRKVAHVTSPPCYSGVALREEFICVRNVSTKIDVIKGIGTTKMETRPEEPEFI
jgi:hypothetical protein